MEARAAGVSLCRMLAMSLHKYALRCRHICGIPFGILATLFAIYGRFKWDRVRHVFMPRSEWGNCKAKYGSGHNLSRHAVIPRSGYNDRKFSAEVNMDS